MTISLRDIVHEMAEIGENHHAFLDKESGELITMNDQQLTAIESPPEGEAIEDWQHRFKKRRETGEIVELPGKFEHKEFSLVERFCETIREKKQQDKLHKAIRGKRAFRDFQTTIGKLGLEDRWIGFRNRALEEIALRWLQEHDIVIDQAA